MKHDKGSAIADDPSPDACYWIMQSGQPGMERGGEYKTKFKYTAEQVMAWECSYPVRPA